ncbi:hypothetical protein ACFFMN_23655 [Planobispora siamensis]|uniref:Uncharacterized protein n=1 Tax=Planobispora siamensis TaxID=936338 RepID=A0A8J3SML8_9ACTN|nr:hypothetical protein [Planobispora siamensis]GIH95361.1 hypothetical protein Psi01_59910 [Planobispora siamensis]
MVKRLGLPLLRVEGDSDAACLMVEPAVGNEWQVLIGANGEITVTWPGDGPFITQGRMSTPDWCAAALEMGVCLLLVGPPYEPPADATLSDVVEKVWEAGGAMGMVAAVAA